MNDAQVGLALVIERGRVAGQAGEHLSVDLLTWLLQGAVHQAPSGLDLTTMELVDCLERADWRYGMRLCRHLRFVTHELDADESLIEWATWIGQALASFEHLQGMQIGQVWLN